MIFFESHSTNPYFNLALEEYVFNNFDQDCFILWQNHNTIVVGNYQNPMEEISTNFVEENDIQVVRRMTGGGAVYHDLGNVNFTFIEKKNSENQLTFEYFTEEIINILRKINVTAENNGRNDITINGKKFSGNAQLVRDGKVLHHGTLLFDSNLEILTKALNVSGVKIESKAIKSVRDRVTNIKEHCDSRIELDAFKKLIRDHYLGKETVEEYVLTQEELEKISEIRDEKYATWEWNYGNSPKFNLKKEGKCQGGIVLVKANVEKGIITDIGIEGDFFADQYFSKCVDALVGKKYLKSQISEDVYQISLSMKGVEFEWLLNLICQ